MVLIDNVEIRCPEQTCLCKFVNQSIALYKLRFSYTENLTSSLVCMHRLLCAVLQGADRIICREN